MLLILSVSVYFGLLFLISRMTARRGTNESFYRADRRSPWYMVAFGMVGASISGVTFISVPGMVLTSAMSYLQLCLGFVLGYLVVAFVLLPLYYRLNLTSIYAYLGQRFGVCTYRTGAWFFLLSKMTGAAVKFYVVCLILQQFVFDAAGVPFVLNVVGMVLLIWLYTHRGGIKTLVVTDTFQTFCLFTALLLIIYEVVSQLGMSLPEACRAVAQSPMSRVFVFDDWLSRQYFWKQFLSGAFIVVVMTGLDQDMMQKNLTCRTLREAQKDMCSYGVAFVPANLLFLSLGVLLTMLGVQGSGDALLPSYVRQAGQGVTVLFSLGIVAASFSTADSALTSMTTSFCIDIRQRPADVRLRQRVHLLMCLVFVLFILLFHLVNSTSLIDAIYTMVSYTYGPLLGLFAFGLFTRRMPCDRWVPVLCVASPVVCYVLEVVAGRVWGYHFGYELLMLNGALTFSALFVSSRYTR
jgi:SSS family solute:Na+ symporter